MPRDKDGEAKPIGAFVDQFDFEVEETEEERIARLPLNEQKRLERIRRSRANRRGRVNPSRIPHPLARTNAFSPRNQNLIETDYERICIVAGYSVIQVKGRELGSQHRDALYALFRLKAVPHTITRDGVLSNVPGERVMKASATWRELLEQMNLTPHTNNLGTVLRAFEEVRAVSFRVFNGSPDQYHEVIDRIAQGKIPQGPGFSDSLINKIVWDGVKLDDEINITYGHWTRQMFERGNLVSLNADVYFRLKTDYAKAIWPFIDSQPDHTEVSEETLANLTGREISEETPKQRGKRRERFRLALDDIVNAGGLKSWTEINADRRRVMRRFTYEHALPRNCEIQEELPLIAAS